MKSNNSMFVLWLVAILRGVSGEAEILIERPGSDLWYWTIFKESKDGAGWNHPSTATPIYSVCDIGNKVEAPKNWLLTEFINIRNAKRLEIEVTYTLRNCPSDVGPFCRTNFSLYSYHTNNTLVTPPDSSVFLKFKKESVITPKTLPAPGDRTTQTFYGSVVTKEKGIYLALLDQGACLTIRKFVVRYRYCSESGAILVKFPRTVAPANDINLIEQEGKCTDPNSLKSSNRKLLGLCLSNGEWNITGNSACFCNKGYELTNGSSDSLACKECQIDFYKNTVSNTKCLPCPANSASNTGRTGCTCDKGYYSLSDGAGCKGLPKAPLTANATVVKVTVVQISWQHSPDDLENDSLTYAVDCFKCESSRDKNCKESCNPGVEYSPSKENISGVEVNINGLPPSTYFLFRVYSVNELNQLEPNRDDWNFAKVFVKTRVSTIHPTEGKTGSSKTVLKMVLYIAVPIVAVLVFLVVLCVVCFCRGRDKKGYLKPVELRDGQVILPTRGQRLYIDPSNYEDPEEALRTFAKELDKKWITLEHIIGGGEFGDVYKGTLSRPGEDTILVAVKTLKTGALRKNRQDFIGEASIMGQFCDPNVIFLEGVVTKTSPMMIVIEFMSNGSLDNYLKKMDGKLTALQLLGMARGVASGMKYLSEMNFVHRDLAARNILVSEGLVCKVADFGLSRELEDSAYETKGGKIPVRWTALEAIEYRKFTPASDVWSYGVLLWEIMSFAERPYWDWGNYEVMERVKSGYRLPPPMNCPKVIHQVMLNCWNAERNKRPKFSEIVKKLDVLIRSPDKLNEDTSTVPRSPKMEYTSMTTVQEWLESIKMGQYHDKFNKAGFTHLNQVANNDELDLNEMGIKLIGHKNKIRKSIREVKKTLDKDSLQVV
ncbi:ephrin type-A receptor 4 [Pocillopora verrucosa]|uniref:ephrin type-A receptor 4 n=1 Tax=Pocillopora verrucosa TaxID=203993 RepID=UPI0033420E2A